MNIKRLLLSPIVGAALLLCLAPAAWAANLIWDFGGGTGNWATAANWAVAPGAANQTPVNGDALYWTSTSNAGGFVETNNLAVDTQIAGMQFGVIPAGGTGNASTGGFTIGGNKIILTGDMRNSTSNATGVQRINLDIELSGARVFFATASVNLLSSGATEDFIFGGTFTGSGSLFLRGDGSNGKFVFNGALNHTSSLGLTDANTTVTLNAANGYTGQTTVARGTMITNVNSALPSTTVVQMGQAFLSANASTLDLNGKNQTIAGLFHETSANNNENHRVTSTAAATLTINNTADYTFGDATHDGQIEGAISLVKGGAATLILGDSNTYTGGTTISRGTMVGVSNTAFGTGTITLGDAATSTNDVSVLLRSSVDITNPVTVSALGSGLAIIGTDGAGVAANATTYSGLITLNRATTFRSTVTDRLAMNGQITGSVGTLTVDGGSRTTFLSTANNFVGNINITGAATILQASVGTAGEVIPNGSSVDVGASATFQLAGSANSTETINALTGSGSITRNVAGLQTLSVGSAGGGGTFSGTIVNGSGTVQLAVIGGTTTLSNGSSTYSAGTVVNGGGTLSVGDVDDAGSNSNIGTGFLALSSGTLLYTGAGLNTTARNLFVDVGPGTFNIQNAAAELKFTGGGTQSQTITKTGPGTLTLDNTGSVTSPITISQGTVQAGTTFSTGAISINNVATGGNTTALLAIEPLTISNNITVNNFGAGTTLGSTNYIAIANTEFSGTLTLAKDVTLQAGSSDRTTFAGQITGAGNITITSPFVANHRIVFERTGAPANNFVGDITLGASADLQIGVGTSIGNRTIPDSSKIDFNTGSRFRIAPTGSGDGETMGVLDSLTAGAGQVDMFTGTAFTLTIGSGGGSATFGGTIINSTGSLAITKTGAGTQTLTGASTYSGATAVHGGTLELGPGGTMVNTSDVTVGQAGSTAIDTLTLNNNATHRLGMGDLVVGGSGVGVVNHNLGDITVGDSADAVENVRIGVGANGTYTIGGFGAATLNVGDNGTGNVNGGRGVLTVGDSGGFNGALNVHAGATINTGDLNVGNGAAGGTVTQDGGDINVWNNSTYTLNASDAPALTATVDHSAGSTFVVGNMIIGNEPAGGTPTQNRYNLSDSGDLNFGDSTNVGAHWGPGDDPSTITINSDGQFNFTGGTLRDVTMIDTNGGTFEQSGASSFYIGQDGVPGDYARTTTIDGGFSLLGGVLYMDIYGVDPTPEECCDGVASQNDQLTVTGAAYLDSTISLDYEGLEPEFGDVFTLLCADDIDYGSGFHVDGGFFRIVPATGDPNGPMALQAIVPEPASVAVWLLVGFAGAWGARRMRKRGAGV